MKIDSFSIEELDSIKFINEGKSVNEIKDYIQDLVINKALKQGHTNIVFMFYTGFGKTMTGVKIKNRYLIKNPDAKINIVSPSSLLQKKWAIESGLNSYVINSFSMKLTDEQRNCDMLFVDELHHALNKDSIYFSNVLKCKAKYKIGLSASLSAKHLEFLKNNNFTYVFNLPITHGTYLELVPDYGIFNLPVNFNLSEKIKYSKEQETIDKYIDLFSPVIKGYENSEYMIDKLLSLVLMQKGKLGRFLDKNMSASQWLEYIYNILIENNVKIKDKAIIIFCAEKLKMAMLNRERIITECIEKGTKVCNILTKFRQNKSIVFTKSKDCSLKLDSQLNTIGIRSKIYNSDISDKNKKLIMEAFDYNMLDSLICINELKEGLDIAKISLIIRHSFNGTQVDAQQILGRAVRFDKDNPDKYAILINLYVKNFKYNNVEHIIPDISKLEYAYKGLPYKWIESIEEIVNNDKDEI